MNADQNRHDSGFAGLQRAMSASEAAALEEAADLIDAALSEEFSPQQEDTNMAMIDPNSGTLVGKQYGQPNATKQTTEGALIHSVSRLGEAAQALSALADTLCGSTGADGEQKLRNVPNGFFDLLAQMRTETDTFVTSIFADIERINGRL